MSGEIEKELFIINPNRRGIVYEDCSEFSTSIFQKVYNKAKKLTVDIVNANEKMKSSKHYGNEFRNREQLDNTITFIGRRGTGKTSAMLSFMEGLKDHHKGRYELDGLDGNRYKFVGLDWIDASLLEECEDIFDIILAKMFAEFINVNKDVYGRRKSDLGYDNQELYRQFERIYTHISNLRKKGSGFEAENNLNILRDLARSTEIREDFANLVRLYNDYLENIHGSQEDRYKEAYLVIAIDDIDLNVDKGYQTLQEIHRYLMIPGLIVLVAINYEEMLLCCEKRYVKAYEKLSRNIVENVGQRAFQMSQEYLEKVLPPYMRVSLPSLKKTDYGLREKRKIEIGGKRYGIKEAMFKLIWEKTRVFYDAKGKKRHFIEPVTLRNLSTNFQLYEEMKELSEKDYLSAYDENYYKVMDDILFRFASDALPQKEYHLFMKWSEEEAIRRGEEIVDEVIRRFPLRDRENIGNKKNLDIDGFVEDYNEFGYSYGELLRSFYCMSRCNLFYKKLVHVLLEQYTVVFSRIFENYKWKELPVSNGDGWPKVDNYENREKLKELMGNSVGGSWTKYMLPQQVKETDGEAYWSAVKFGKLEEITIVKCPKEWGEKGRKFGEGTWESCKELLESKEIEVLMFWMFFFEAHSGKKGEDGKHTFTILKPGQKGLDQQAKKSGENEPRGNDDKKEEEDSYRIRLLSYGVSFNVLNFVNNSFDYYKVIRNFYIAIVEALYKSGYFEKNEFKENELIQMETANGSAEADESKKPETGCGDVAIEECEEPKTGAGNIEIDKSVREKIRKLVEELMQPKETDSQSGISLLNRFINWSKNGGLAIPVYNFDITYNLFKRLVIERKREKREAVRKEDTFHEIKALFQSIFQRLEAQDNFYNDIIETESQKSEFAKNFKECPIVEVFLTASERDGNSGIDLKLYEEWWQNYKNIPSAATQSAGNKADNISNIED